MSFDAGNGWEIHSFNGLGSLCFGQTRTDIRSLLGTPTRVFKKVPFAESETDAYNDLGIHLYYDSDDRLESVDAFEPSTISFHGVALLGRSIEDVVKELVRLGYQHREYMFSEAGFSLYVEQGVVRGVTVFPQGYYDASNPSSPINRATRAAAQWSARGE